MVSNINRIIAILFLVTVCCQFGVVARATTPTTDQPQPFFFIQFSDPQFGFIDNNKSITAEVELMDKVVTIINRLKPPFVVVTGDFVNHSQSEEQINAYKEAIGKIDPQVKVYMIPGNHDIEASNPETMDTYKKNYGEPRFSFHYNDCAFIGIDSNVIKNGDAEGEEEQYQWLKQQLEDSKDKKFKFIFSHCSVFLRRLDEPENYSNYSFAMREKYIGLFQEYNVNAVFSGHLHDNAYGKAGDMEMITIGAVGRALGKGFSGMNIVKVYPDNYTSEYIALDKVPQQIILNSTDTIRDGLIPPPQK